jgi:hypothetical protein
MRVVASESAIIGCLCLRCEEMMWQCCFNRCQTRPKNMFPRPATLALEIPRYRPQDHQRPRQIWNGGAQCGPHRMHELVTVRNPAALALPVRNSVGFKIPSLSAALVRISSGSSDLTPL